MSDYKSRCDPTVARREMANVCSRLIVIRGATCIQLRQGALRMRNRLTPANASGLDAVVGRGGAIRRNLVIVDGGANWWRGVLG